MWVLLSQAGRYSDHEPLIFKPGSQLKPNFAEMSLSL